MSHCVRTEKLSLKTLVQMDGLPRTSPKKIGFKTKSDQHIAAPDADTDFLGGCWKIDAVYVKHNEQTDKIIQDEIIW